MNYAVALIVLEFVITMLFYPLKIGAKGHASLAHDKIELDLTVFRVPVARLRIKKDEHKFALQINGKKPKKEKKLSVTQAANAIKQYRIEGIKARGSLLALIGADDARDTAIAYAIAIGILRPIVDDLRIFTAQPSDTLEIDGRVKIKINIVQIVSLIAATIKG